MSHNHLRTLLAAALLLAATALRAQGDSVLVTGTVANLHTQQPEPFCLVQLVQDGVLRHLRVTDDEGFFAIDSLPAGTYTLQISVGILPLFRTELSLTEDANLTLYIDTIRSVDLMTVNIVGQRHVIAPPEHKLGAFLITSASDRRIWDMIEGRRDASASEANPADLRPLYEDRQDAPRLHTPTTIADTFIKYRANLLSSKAYMNLPFWERERVYLQVTRQVNSIVKAAFPPSGRPRKSSRHRP